MLFMPFTKPIQGTLALWFVFLLTIAGCTSVPTKHDETDTNLTKIGEEMVDMVKIKPINPSNKRQPAFNPTSENGQTYPLLQQHYELNITAQQKHIYQLALKYIDSKQWDKAKAELNTLIAQQAIVSNSYVNLALISFHNHENQTALKQINQAISANEHNPIAYNIKGVILRTMGEFDGAEKNYLKALSIWPQYSDASLNMAVLLEMYRGRFLDAETYYQQTIANNADNELAKRWLAGLRIKIKRAGLTQKPTQVKANQNTKTTAIKENL